MTKNRQISYWVQHADFSTVDGTPVPVAKALEIFHGHDWTDEMEQARHLVSSKVPDVCPPGIGYFVVDQEDLLLHICPQSWDSVDISCAYPTEKIRRRLFGLFSPMKIQLLEEVSCEKFPITEVKEVITLFFESRYPELIRLLKNNAPRSMA